MADQGLGASSGFSGSNSIHRRFAVSAINTVPRGPNGGAIGDHGRAGSHSWQSSTPRSPGPLPKPGVASTVRRGSTTCTTSATRTVRSTTCTVVSTAVSGTSVVSATSSGTMVVSAGEVMAGDVSIVVGVTVAGVSDTAPGSSRKSTPSASISWRTRRR
ncbi:MAG: hypothetical protein R2713_20655 [Ilumatobacteraceae bacterium]